MGVRGRLPLSGGDGPKGQEKVAWAIATTSRRGQSNPLSADSGTPSAKIYGPLITLGLQNHFHSRQPK